MWFLLRWSFSEPASGLRAQLPCRWVAWASCSPPFQRYLGGQSRSGRTRDRRTTRVQFGVSLQGPGVPEAAAKRRFLNPLRPDDLTLQSSFIAMETAWLPRPGPLAARRSPLVGWRRALAAQQTHLRCVGDLAQRLPRHNKLLTANLWVPPRRPGAVTCGANEFEFALVAFVKSLRLGKPRTPSSQFGKTSLSEVDASPLRSGGHTSLLLLGNPHESAARMT